MNYQTTPPWGATLKRSHFTFHEVNGHGWVECSIHQSLIEETIDDGTSPIKDVDCIACVVEEQVVSRIVRRLEAELQSLKQYGRTELWGINKALHIIKEGLGHGQE